MFTLEKREAAFKQDLNDFEAMLNRDLNARMSETTKKFSFDFFAEQPMEDAKSPFTWEKNEEPIKIRKPICRLQPKKEKMSVDAIINDKNGENCRFSLVGRNSIFSSQAATESTSCMSRMEGMDSSIQSMMSGPLGTSFNLDMDNSMNFDGRPTVGLNCQFKRR